MENEPFRFRKELEDEKGDLRMKMEDRVKDRISRLLSENNENGALCFHMREHGFISVCSNDHESYKVVLVVVDTENWNRPYLIIQENSYRNYNDTVSVCAIKFDEFMSDRSLLGYTADSEVVKISFNKNVC